MSSSPTSDLMFDGVDRAWEIVSWRNMDSCEARVTRPATEPAMERGSAKRNRVHGVGKGKEVN